uniref:ZSWIM4-8 C-terminal domain-containing protein n=1 Tax=Caenorhabditis japonica TaxID=281687 RepID=A0A8R1IF66_CAEJA
MGEVQMEQIRAKAIELIDSEPGSGGEIPPITFTKFIFLALYWTEPANPPTRAPQNPPAAAASPVLQQNRRLLLPSDSELALKCALNVVGCRPILSDRYALHWETIRRERSELICLLLTRYKDSQEKCALIIDRALDPKMHRMYQHHHSNAAYFLERCPAYLKRFKQGQRPIFPYTEEAQQADDEEESDENPDPSAEYEAQIDAELQKMNENENSITEAGAISRDRLSDEGLQSSSSSDISSQTSGPSTSISTDSVNSHPANMPGLTKENKATINAMRKNQGSTNTSRKPRKRAVQSITFDHRNYVTDSHVFHTFELAKKILFEAGGPQSTVIWGNPAVGGVNRRLHLCAIVIATYALGISNRISPSWNTRTYNHIAGWVATQVQEVGSQSVEIIRQIWMAHFTPNEIAHIADKSAPVSDPGMKHETAKLALSVLPFAHALTDDEVINAIRRCRNDSRSMLIAGLLAMDTPQFRQIGRTRTLFAVMQHWYDLSFEEEPPRNPQPLPPPPAGMIVNPYANLLPRPPQPPQNHQQQQMHRQRQRQRNAVPQQPHLQVAPHRLPQSVFLYPQAYRSEVARLHQSHSAPQLGGNPGEVGPDQEHLAVPPIQVSNHQNMPPPSPTNLLLNAYYYGMRAMDCLATSPGEERQMYLKFGVHPPYADELMCLYNVAKQLGGQYLYSFYCNAGRSVLSPYILHQYARESVQHFPHRLFNQQQQQQQQQRLPQPMPLVIPTFPQTPANVRYPHVRFSMPGQITNLFLSHGYQQVTGELFERCCEQYLQAIVNKMNSPKVNDSNEFIGQICSFLQGAHEAFQWIPNMGRPLFEDFVRVVKRQKSYRKDCAQSVNQLIGQLCG